MNPVADMIDQLASYETDAVRWLKTVKAPKADFDLERSALPETGVVVDMLVSNRRNGGEE